MARNVIAIAALQEAEELLGALHMMADAIKSEGQRSAFKRIVEHAEMSLDRIKVELTNSQY